VKSSFPKRIISLVPSQTELLFDLGLDEEVIGITKFCVHPTEWFKTKTRVGGTKTADIKKIKSLNPDLIIANKEENVKEQIEELSTTISIHTTEVETFEDALQMIRAVGTLVGKQDESTEIIEKIQSAFCDVQNSNFISFSNNKENLINIAYLIWKDPYMTIGGDTFINNMLKMCGFNNVFEQLKRYPQITIEDVKASPCEVLILSSEPYPFKQKHLDELQLKLPTKKIVLADGEMFSWFGSRLIKAASYFQQFKKLIHQ
jgi:ABC-type Fe3+-hydroxamate transport system substrate-binding protein